MIYTIKSNCLSLSASTDGAQLWSLADATDGTEYLWQGDPAVWPRRAPIMFPFCGRLLHDRYCGPDGTFYSSAVHGFAYLSQHFLARRTADTLSFSLTDTPQTRALYPFSFRLTTSYALWKNTVRCTLRVENTGTVPLPFNTGFHTGYRCPFLRGTTAEEYALRFEKPETPLWLRHDKTGIRTGEEKPLFENKSRLPLCDGFFETSYFVKGLVSSFVELSSPDPLRAVRVFFREFPYLGFWSKPGKLHFVCIEPWNGLPDSYLTGGGTLYDKEQIRLLAPQSSYAASQVIEILNPAFFKA